MCAARRICCCTREAWLRPSSRRFSTIGVWWSIARSVRLRVWALARAYATQGDAAKAKAAYQDFLTLWKDADPNIPILIAAKAEYAKLQ
jgi:hypothetical protein